MKVELNPEVYSDLLEIVQFYYDSDDTVLAADFYVEFRKFVDEMAVRPQSFPKQGNCYRRVNLKRFPFHILFRKVDNKTLRILVVKHNHRDPRFGLDRH